MLACKLDHGVLVEILMENIEGLKILVVIMNAQPVVGCAEEI